MNRAVAATVDKEGSGQQGGTAVDDPLAAASGRQLELEDREASRWTTDSSGQQGGTMATDSMEGRSTGAVQLQGKCL
ncbi:putative ribonuclease ZC3H12C [Sesbania bispinosa]|nr:putative ribonuclease ZC3H12C [Sesbania bispinosa]